MPIAGGFNRIRRAVAISLARIIITTELAKAQSKFCIRKTR